MPSRGMESQGRPDLTLTRVVFEYISVSDVKDNTKFNFNKSCI